MKTLPAPNTTDALLDAIQTAAQANPVSIWIGAVVLTAAFASWAAGRI